MSFVKVVACVSGLPEGALWPEMVGIFERSAAQLDLKWELPLLACRAVGGDVSVAVIGAAAVACMQLSLVLVDDMLDEDPGGIHCQVGQAAAANLAFAFQSAAFRVIEEAPVEVDLRAGVYASLARMALTSACGQNLDAQNLRGEENYWRIVKTKSSPFFGASLHIGALLGRASPQVAEALRDLGFLIGEVIQIYDDLLDALATPASSDWKQGRNNLAILYALTADHPERDQFKALSSQADDSRAIADAQEILVRCGAASYCAYHIIERYRAGLRLLNSVALVDPSPLLSLIDGYPGPLMALLERVGVEMPEIGAC